MLLQVFQLGKQLDVWVTTISLVIVVAANVAGAVHVGGHSGEAGVQARARRCKRSVQRKRNELGVVDITTSDATTPANDTAAPVQRDTSRRRAALVACVNGR